MFFGAFGFVGSNGFGFHCFLLFFFFLALNPPYYFLVYFALFWRVCFLGFLFFIPFCFVFRNKVLFSSENSSVHF